MRRQLSTRSRRWSIFLVVCLVLTVLSTVGLVAGQLFSLEIGVGPGFGMLILGMWRGTFYLAAIGENGWWWFELKFTNRQPLGSGALGFRWDFDPIEDEYGIGIPLWLTTPLLLWLSWALWKRRRAAPIGLCPRCNYDLRATPERCPECGTVTAAGGQAVA
jgi:hypothetical protein